MTYVPLQTETDSEKFLTALRERFFPEDYNVSNIFAFGLLQAEVHDQTINVLSLQSMLSDEALVLQYIDTATEVMAQFEKDKNHVEISSQLSSLLVVGHKTLEISNSTNQLLGSVNRAVQKIDEASEALTSNMTRATATLAGIQEKNEKLSQHADKQLKGFKVLIDRTSPAENNRTLFKGAVLGTLFSIVTTLLMPKTLQNAQPQEVLLAPSEYPKIAMAVHASRPAGLGNIRIGALVIEDKRHP